MQGIGCHQHEAKADWIAEAVLDSFAQFQSRFSLITARAKQRFVTRDWSGAHRDSAERIELYELYAQQARSAVIARIGGAIAIRDIWVQAKACYGGLVLDRHDQELAQTFYNSVTRRVHATRGVEPDIEFHGDDFVLGEGDPEALGYISFLWDEDVTATFRAALGTFVFDAPYRDLEHDCAALATQLQELLTKRALTGQVRRWDVLRPVFFRDTGAYLVGRLITDSGLVPLVLSLRHLHQGIVVDAMLADEDATSILFSFAHSYFFVAVDHNRMLIDFLQGIMPQKRTDELYASLGHHKHGKTELNRTVRRHLLASEDCFETARGKRGMVMLVFTLPSLDIVFKVIKDRCSPPKRTPKHRVLEGYELVFKRDRVGRLVDAQEFSNLEFGAHRFAPSLLAELLEEASETVTRDGDTVTIHHLYTERRVEPLDLYLAEADGPAAMLAIIDYGNAIRELAAANIFAGDLFLKNFGVTRHGRVVFYDYDELCLLSDCNFRRMPEPMHDFQELEAETWFPVADGDIFPEEFRTFLGLPRELMAVFEREHGELFTADFWNDMQKQHQAGEIIETFPYHLDARLG